MRKLKAAGPHPDVPARSVRAAPDAKPEVFITLIDYDADTVAERQVGSPQECTSPKDERTVRWINVDGVHRPNLVEEFGRLFGLHPLVVEDILNTTQRPKCEDYGDFIYLVLKMLSLNQNTGDVDSEHISLILGKGFVLSFQERPGDVFDLVRARIRTGKGRIRNMGADYLVYSLISAIVDNYFVVCESLGERIEALEDALVEDPKPARLLELQAVKTQVLSARRSIWPLREVISTLGRGDSSLIARPTEAYLRSAHDHTMQVVDTIETYREALSTMMDIYLSSLSNRMNEVMKVLTVIATIFMPLSFIAGIYGMNFRLMPELEWRFGYPLALFIMFVVATTMVVYFRKRGWM